MRSNVIPPGETIGIIGGGQLGRMMIHAASKLGYSTTVFCEKEDSPAFHVANHSVVASYTDEKALEEFGKRCAVVTFEFENVPHQTIKRLEECTFVRPGWKSLYMSQNRIREKGFLKEQGIPTADYREVHDEESLIKAVNEIGTPCLLKTAELGYDGKGQLTIENQDSLKYLGKDAIVEEIVPFQSEISVVAARGLKGEFQPFCPVQNIHQEGILRLTIAPAKISESLSKKACEITQLIMEKLNHVGVLTVEFFVVSEDLLLVNEIAPRPHNSGHWTIDACWTSQFEQHIRAICGLKLGDPTRHSDAMMKNLIGLETDDWKQYLTNPTSKLHLYGKKESRAGRKMGHVTELYK